MMENGALDLESIPSLLKSSIARQQTFLQFSHEKAKAIYRKIAPGTKEHYELWFRFMESWRGIVSFADVTERNIERMDEVLLSRGVKKEVSRWMYHKTLKTFIFKAMKEGLMKKNPYDNLGIKKRSDTGIDRYLTPEEFHRFESCKIGPEHLARVRDLFVFQTYTCMSYSDLEAFDYRLCEKTDGMTIYKSYRVKTDKPFMFVLVKPALAILQKYDYKLPIISNVKYNDYLKSAVTYARIDKPVCTHWARHTGATMLLNDGKVPMHVVQHILGHASIRETERTYAKVLDRTIIESMSAFEKRRIKQYR
jgi:integrase